MAAYEILLLNTAIPQIQAAQSGDTYVVPRDIAFSTVANLANGTNLLPSLTFSSDTNTGIYREGADALGFTAGGGTNQMVLTSTGLGIGTNNPANKLTVSGATQYISVVNTTAGSSVSPSYAGIRFYGFAENANGLIASIDGGNSQTNDLAGVIRFSTQAAGGGGLTTHMLLDSSGNLGLGVTPSASWNNIFKAMQIGSASYLSVAAQNTVTARGSILWNAIGSGDESFVYRNTGDPANRFMVGSGFFAWYTAASGNANDPITFTQAMTLDASGNLGVGATSGSRRITARYDASTVYSASSMESLCINTYAINADTTIGSYTGIQFTAGNNSDSAIVGIRTADGSAALAFGTRNAGSGAIVERARITSGGDLLVGKTVADFTTVGCYIDYRGTFHSAAASIDYLNCYNTTAGLYRFYVSNAGTINATSSTINTISDQRLKENIQDLDVGISAVMSLKPRKFDWKSGKGKDIKGDRGFIAQEFEQVFPDMVGTWKDPAPEGEEPYKSVRADLIPVLVKAIQEQQAMINELKAEVAALKGA